MSADYPERIGAYRILGVLGRGGMGVLYHARDERRHRDVALKVMLPDVVADENARARFQHEARLAATVQHRNVVRVFECGEDGDVPFIAMELLRGTTLASHLAGGAVMSLETKLDTVIQVCEGLQHLHERGIVHRDVKPSNIWLTGDGGVKLLDLGIAAQTGSNVTRHGGLAGSVAYVAPEQISGQPVDGRADIFSAGVVLYELLSGRRPFEADTVTLVLARVLQEDAPDIRRVVPAVPEEVALALETALQKDPARRYASAAEFASDLRLARDADRTPSAVVAPTVTPPRTRDHIASDPAAALTTVPLRARERGTPSGPVPDVLPDLALRGPGARPGAGDVEIRPDARPAADAEAPRRGSTARARIGGLAAAAAVAIAAIAAIVWWMLPSPYLVDVRSEPAGAAILVDGRDTGQITPAVLTLDTRPERIALNLSGHAPADVTLTEWDGQRTLVRHTLQRLLHVRSDPVGARVVLDGTDTGLITPVDVPLGGAPPSAIELRLEGHLPARRELSAAIIDAGEVEVRLDPEPPPPPPTVPVRVALSGPYPFSVSGCGTRAAAAARHDFRVAAPCRLRLQAPEYFLDATRDVTDRAGDRVTLEAPRTVRVEVRSRHQGCRVVIGGRDFAYPTAVITMAEGASVPVTLQCPDGRTPTTTRPFRADADNLIWRIDDFLPPSF